MRQSFHCFQNGEKKIQIQLKLNVTKYVAAPASNLICKFLVLCSPSIKKNHILKFHLIFFGFMMVYHNLTEYCWVPILADENLIWIQPIKCSIKQ